MIGTLAADLKRMSRESVGLPALYPPTPTPSSARLAEIAVELASIRNGVERVESAFVAAGVL